jgi:hypothetical protein
MLEQNTGTQTEIAAVAREISAITPGKPSPISISRRSQGGDWRSSCSAKMKRGEYRQAARTARSEGLDLCGCEEVQPVVKSRPTFKSVTPICVSILWASDAGGFPWSNGFHYDPDSG